MLCGISLMYGRNHEELRVAESRESLLDPRRRLPQTARANRGAVGREALPIEVSVKGSLNHVDVIRNGRLLNNLKA